MEDIFSDFKQSKLEDNDNELNVGKGEMSKKSNSHQQSENSYRIGEMRRKLQGRKSNSHQ